MKEPIRASPLRDTAAWLPAAAAIWWVVSAAYLGMVYSPLTPDSYAYVAAAQSLLESGRLSLPFAPAASDTVPAAFSAWPPGYPLLIAAASLTGIDAWLAARMVAALCVVCVLVVGFVWCRRQDGGLWAYALSLLCGMSATVAATLWSEGPFLLALSLTFAGLVAWRRSEQPSKASLLLACGGLCAALLTRHAGWFVVPAVTLLLLQARGRKRQVCAFVAAALLPAALWFLRNRLEGAPGRGWSLELASLWRAFGETAAALGKVAIVPWSASLPVQALSGAALAALVMYAGWPAAKSATRNGSGVAFAFGISLLSGTWAARLVEPALVVSDRMIWPAWIFLCFAAGMRPGVRQLNRSVKTVVFLALAITQTIGIWTLPGREPRQRDPNLHFHAATQPHADEAIVSNEAWRAWRLFGTSGYYLPRSHWRQSPLAFDTLSAWAARRGVAYLVWFDDGLSESESIRRYGELGAAGAGRTLPGLELVGQGSTYHTYRIQQSDEL